MADEIKWIKTQCDLFNNRKIKQIEVMPEGDSILVIWVKLLCLAGSINDAGYIYLTKEVPYTDELLANEFNRSVQLVRLALMTFQKFGMIEIIDNILHVSNWAKYQNIEGMEKVKEQTRKRVARHRANIKLIGNKADSNECNATSNVTVTLRNATDIEEEKEIELDNNLYEQQYINNARARLIDSFAQEMCRPITPMEMQLLISWENDYSIDLVILALSEAVANNKRSFKYIEAILLSWKAKGITSVIDAQNEIDQFKHYKKLSNSNDDTADELMKKDVSELEKKKLRMVDLKTLMDIYSEDEAKYSKYLNEYEKLAKEVENYD